MVARLLTGSLALEKKKSDTLFFSVQFFSAVLPRLVPLRLGALPYQHIMYKLYVSKKSCSGEFASLTPCNGPIF